MINLTMIGTAIFVSMDLPDICLAVRRRVALVQICQQLTQLSHALTGVEVPQLP